MVKPYREVAVCDTAGESVRPILKRKIPEFAEDRRFHEAQKWEENSATEAASSLPLDLLKWEAYNRVTENRLRATVSKIGPADGTRRPDGLLFTLLVAEVIEEARTAVPDAWAALYAEQRAELFAYVRHEVRTLLRTTQSQS